MPAPSHRPLTMGQSVVDRQGEPFLVDSQGLDRLLEQASGDVPAFLSAAATHVHSRTRTCAGGPIQLVTVLRPRAKSEPRNRHTSLGIHQRSRAEARQEHH
jgi:hypothetical protein